MRLKELHGEARNLSHTERASRKTQRLCDGRIVHVKIHGKEHMKCSERTTESFLRKDMAYEHRIQQEFL